MSLNIAGFIKSLLPSFDKSDLESDLEISLEAIGTITDTYINLDEIFKVAKLQHKLNKNAVKEFYKELGNVRHKVKLSPGMNLGTDTITLFKNVKLNGDLLYKEISDAVNDVVVSQALTAYKVNLLRSVAHYYFITRFALDFANYLYIHEAEESGTELGKEYKLNKKQIEFIEKNLWIYARLLSVYGEEHNVFKSKLDQIEEITLPKEAVDEAIDSYNSTKVDVFNNLPQNFIGSPIYTIRLVFAQWEADRYKSMKDKKRLLELRYLHLKLMKEQGTSDVNVEREIEYLQKSITNLDYKLSKLEESVDD